MATVELELAHVPISGHFTDFKSVHAWSQVTTFVKKNIKPFDLDMYVLLSLSVVALPYVPYWIIVTKNYTNVLWIRNSTANGQLADAAAYAPGRRCMCTHQMGQHILCKMTLWPPR